MRKIVLKVILILTMGIALAPQETFAQSSISIYLNGKEQVFDQPPVIKEGRTMVPLRGILEGMGATVSWDPSTNVATVIKESKVIKLSAGEKVVHINDQKVMIDVPAIIENGRMLVPIRFISENIGAQIRWSGAEKAVYIESISAKEVLEKTIKAMGEVESLVAQYELTQTAKGNGQEIMKTHGMSVAITMEPFSLYGIYEEASEKMEMYVIENTFIVKKTGDEEWLELPVEMAEQYFDVSDYKLDQELKNLRVVSNAMTVTEEKDHYVLTINAGPEYSELLKEVLKPEFEHFGEEFYKELIINKLDETITVDKDTFVVLDTSVNMEMIMADKMTINQSIEANYKNYNVVPSIGLPKDFLEQKDNELNEHTEDETVTFVPKLALDIPFKYLYPVPIDGLDGFINEKGEVVIPAQYEYAEDFSEGLASVLVNEKYGYINESGEMVIEPQFDMAYNFNEGLALVQDWDNWMSGYINKQGELVIPFEYDYADDFSEGLAAVELDWKKGYINTSGEFVIKPQYQMARPFSEGLAAVSENIREQVNYIDKTGKVIIEDAKSTADFVNGLAQAQIDGKWGFIDQTGEVVIEPQFDFVWGFQEGYAPVQVGEKWGFIDTEGSMVVEPIYDMALWFSEGLAPIKVNGKMGYINSKGEVVIEPVFEGVNSFKDGLADVLIDGEVGYINQKGELIFDPSN